MDSATQGMDIILITGISGSGKSVALNVLEDTGCFCVDNLPPVLLPSLVATCREENRTRLAVAVDSRSAHSLSGLPAAVEKLRAEGCHIQVIFLTADNQSLINRFSETRRSHPLSRAPSPAMTPPTSERSSKLSMPSGKCLPTSRQSPTLSTPPTSPPANCATGSRNAPEKNCRILP
ncbi:MAG: hypothetical protein NC211_09220 [Alistipes senegalensis]|nr:hypothetical protein [Alistipes senegalensis]